MPPFRKHPPIANPSATLRPHFYTVSPRPSPIQRTTPLGASHFSVLSFPHSPISPFPYGADPRSSYCPFVDSHSEAESLLFLGCSPFAISGHRGPADSTSEGGPPTDPAFSAPQCRYEIRRATTTPGATASGPKSSVQLPPAKRARTSGPGESSRVSQPEPRADTELPSDMSPKSIIRRPMLTTPPIEGNSDCRSRPFHLKFYFDQEAFRQQPKLQDSYVLLQRYHLE
ncbi:hypothetical protein CK203_051768 [Vitis vinifera]|uniref:Uncharacterized protein n=1 Tax=Vitis vinifera TaxID=29760 RepID=A0A438HGJ7_VITVI|nr:hypothetical protein CK203_051768 [Vitis vinifera]